MEWVETTGKTVEEALEAALDQLGVDSADAEYEVLEEAKTGLFGRLRTEARVRARVRPTTPRPKEERRGRGRKSGSAGAARSAPADAGAADEDRAERPAAAAAPRRNNDRRPPAGKRATPREDDRQVTDTAADIPLAEQGEIATEFLRGVLDRFGAPEATVATHEIDEDTLELRIEGHDLGLLIGPKGAALQSLQELTRTVVQRRTGARSGRLLVDVAGYRQRRKEALERFARKIADDVLASASRVVLEPMNPSDRKVIHDTINGIDGVSTSSEGEEPRRRVVVSPV
jgi:spoIIIJ-associated protein